jgi:hypothetical protein
MVGTRSTPVPTIPDSLRSLSPKAVEDLLGSANDTAREGSPPPPPEGRRRAPTSSPVADPPMVIRQRKAKKKDTGGDHAFGDPSAFRPNPILAIGTSTPAPLGTLIRMQSGALPPSSGPSGGDSSSAGSGRITPSTSSATIGSSRFPSAGTSSNPLVIDADQFATSCFLQDLSMYFVCLYSSIGCLPSNIML